MFLPDINFWLALTFEVHAHHVRAKEFFDTPSSGPIFLSAFARSADFQLVTFDNGFRQFKDLNYVIL